MATYEVRYLGRQSPVEIDGQVVLLRCLRDGNYFQFFTATAGRLDVELALHAASANEDVFWRCFTNDARSSSPPLWPATPYRFLIRSRLSS